MFCGESLDHVSFLYIESLPRKGSLAGVEKIGQKHAKNIEAAFFIEKKKKERKKERRKKNGDNFGSLNPMIQKCKSEGTEFEKRAVHKIACNV